MAHSFFGRAESTGVVSKAELYFLWAMVHQEHVNTVVWFMKHIMHILNRPTGRICIGGLITLMAFSLGFEFEAGLHNIVPVPSRNDIDVVLHMKLCRLTEDGRVELLDAEGHAIHDQHEDSDEDDDPTRH